MIIDFLRNQNTEYSKSLTHIVSLSSPEQERKQEQELQEPADQRDTLYKNLDKQPSSPGVPVAQWLEHLTSVKACLHRQILSR